MPASPASSNFEQVETTVSVVAPVFNEEAVVAQLVVRVMEVFDALTPNVDRHELVIVNDGSTDRTLERLREIARTEPRLTIVNLTRNFGHQPAVSAGLAHSTGDVVVVIDGDLQDDPAEIPRLLDAYREGNDVVYAIRTNRKEAAWLRLAYALHYRIANRLTRPRLPRDAGDFALMSRRVVDAVNALPERQRYVRGLRAWVGFEQVGVPVERRARESGTTKYSLARLINLAFDGLFSFSIVPIRLALVLGLVTLLTGIVYSAYAVALRVISGEVPQGFTSLVVIMILLNGIVLIFLGVIGEYVGRIYEEVKGRPAYLVDDVIEGGRDG